MKKDNGMQGKYLINTDSWFIAPDGRSYQAVWGDVLILEDSVLGLKTNRNSTNWYARVGTEEHHVIIAGCQIHYATKSDKRPNTDEALSWDADAAHGVKEYFAPTRIYIPEEA